MRARVFITPKKGVLDPPGKAVEHSLHALGFGEAHDVHLGKYIEVSLALTDRARAEQRMDEMCRKLLANPITEDYEAHVEAAG